MHFPFCARARQGAQRFSFNAGLTGIGLQVTEQSNVIIRNLVISKVLAANGDAVGVQYASNIWLDHLELYSDKDHDKDYYDGLLVSVSSVNYAYPPLRSFVSHQDVTHGTSGVTVSHTYLHDHFKGSLVGAADTNTEVHHFQLLTK